MVRQILGFFSSNPCGKKVGCVEQQLAGWRALGEGASGLPSVAYLKIRRLLCVGAARRQMEFGGTADRM
jgi:hypothetical protein